MKCPIDGSDLVMTERQGIEIDYCPQCRGVWLDRGELDKIIDRAAPAAQQPAAAQPPAFSQPAASPFSYPDRRYEPRRHDDDDDRYKQHDYRHKKRKGFLGEIFDF
jgi:uncharacterized protein